MPRSFISHSGEDYGHAIAPAVWLNPDGWDDNFLDRDHERGFAGSDRWDRMTDASKPAQAAWSRTAVNDPRRLDAAIRGLSAAFLNNYWRQHFEGHEKSVNSVALSADGSHILTRSQNKIAQLWDISSIPKDKHAFQIAREELPDHDLTNLVGVFPLAINEPICSPDYNPPLPALPEPQRTSK